MEELRSELRIILTVLRERAVSKTDWENAFEDAKDCRDRLREMTAQHAESSGKKMLIQAAHQHLQALLGNLRARDRVGALASLKALLKEVEALAEREGAG